MFLCNIRTNDDESLKKLLPAMDRERLRNEQLFRSKARGDTLFNDTVVRFSWHADRCDLPLSKGYDDRYPEANKLAADMLSSAFDPQRVSIMAVWETNATVACISGSSKSKICDTKKMCLI